MENLIIQFLLSSSLLVDGSCPGPRSWPSPQHCQGPTAHWVGVEWEPGWEVEWEFSSTLPATHWVGVEWEQVATDLLNTRLPLTHSPTPNPKVKEFNRGGEKNCKDIWRNPFRINSPTPSCLGISTVLLLKTSTQAKLFFSLRRAQNAIEIILRDFLSDPDPIIKAGITDRHN